MELLVADSVDTALALLTIVEANELVVATLVDSRGVGREELRGVVLMMDTFEERRETELVREDEGRVLLAMLFSPLEVGRTC